MDSSLLEENFYFEYKFQNIIFNLTDDFTDIEHIEHWFDIQRQFYTYLTL